MKELYIENYKTLRKKLKKINTDTIRKDTPCLWIGRITIVKMSVLPKTSTDFLQFLSNSNDIFHRTSANILKFMWDHKRSWIAWKYWERRKKLGVFCINKPKQQRAKKRGILMAAGYSSGLSSSISKWLLLYLYNRHRQFRLLCKHH